MHRSLIIALAGILVIIAIAHIMPPSKEAPTPHIEPKTTENTAMGTDVQFDEEHQNDTALAETTPKTEEPVAPIPPKQQEKPQTTPAPQPVETDARETPDSVSREIFISISDFAFEQEEIVINKGDRVTWTNLDAARHDVVMDNGGPGPNGPLLAKGESYSYTFTESGTYAYHCSPHPFMKGTVTVR